MNTSTRVEFGLYDVTARSDSAPVTEGCKGFLQFKQGFTVGIRAESEQVRHAGNAAMAHGRQLPVFPRNASAVFLGLWSTEQSNGNGALPIRPC